MPNELKPCPFCGKELLVKQDDELWHYWWCPWCDVTWDNAARTQEEAVKNANRRAMPECVRELNDAMQGLGNWILKHTEGYPDEMRIAYEAREAVREYYGETDNAE